MRRALLRALPYLVTLGVIAAILWRYPVDRIVAEMAAGEVAWLLPIAFLMMLGSLLFVSFADWLVVRSAGAARPVGYFDLLRAKAGSSLLDLVNYAAGHGVYGLWIARFGGLPAALGAGVLLYLMAADLGGVCTAATLALLASDAPPPGLLPVAAALAGLMLFFAATGPLDLLRNQLRLFEPWRVVPARAGVASIAVRAAQQCIFILCTWAAARAFGLDLPLAVMAVYVPLITLVSALPVNVGGFGAVTAVWLLLTPWAPGERIVAFQFLWNFALAGAVVLRGLPFVRGVLRETAKAE